MLQQILSLYQTRYNFDLFYDNLFYNIKTWPEEHVHNTRFLYGYPLKEKNVVFEAQRPTVEGNIRVDLPIWYGDILSRKKFVFVGLEPRDTNMDGYLNIEHKDNYVFATPFALERPWSPYQKAFSYLINQHDSFFYFTDAVKEYHVADKVHKKVNDIAARKNFKLYAESSMAFLEQELTLISPTKVFALGTQTHLFLQRHFKNKFDIIAVRHPARGGLNKCRQQIDDILANIM
jgi:hypothetical protein